MLRPVLMGGHRVLVIGGGGREHALCLGLNESPNVSQIFCSPGNAGTALFATNIDLPTIDGLSVVEFCQQESISLVVVGPEAPLLDTLPFAIMVFLWGQLFLGNSLLSQSELIVPMLIMIVITPILHRSFNLIGYYIGWKDVPY